MTNGSRGLVSIQVRHLDIHKAKAVRVLRVQGVLELLDGFCAIKRPINVYIGSYLAQEALEYLAVEFVVFCHKKAEKLTPKHTLGH